MSKAKGKKSRCKVTHTPTPPFNLYENPSEPSFSEGFRSVVNLLKRKKNIVVITGAGISTSTGIPDFRSKGTGLYERLDIAKLGLASPEELFDKDFFQYNPEPFYHFAKHLYFPLGTDKRVQPSDAHKFLALLEERKMLLRVYSQNIDGLEEVAGISSKKIVYAHGSLREATCLTCGEKYDASGIEANVLEGTVARCKKAKEVNLVYRADDAASTRSRKRPKRGDNVCNGCLKPGITFFGESLGNNVSKMLESDRKKVDALIVIGTSLSVAPISKVIEYFPSIIPRILINQMIVKPKHVSPVIDEVDTGKSFEREGYVFDAYLLGFCDDVARSLGKHLFHGENEEDAENGELLSLVSESSSYEESDWCLVAVPRERVFLFAGALPHRLHDGETYSEIANCDGCGEVIRSVIRKCTVCFDYDLCQECYPSCSREHFSGKHRFTIENV